MKTLFLSIGICSFLLAPRIQIDAQEWTRFRGPNGTGISPSKTIPVRWTESDFKWKTRLPGSGHSSPVLWGDTIFLTSTDEPGARLNFFAVRAADGEILWKRDVSFNPFRKHQFNSFASATPAVDADRVYVCWATPEQFTLAALDHAGNFVWKRELGPWVSQHGGGGSPIVYGDKVILANDQKGDSSLIAVEAATGKTVWQLPRGSDMAAYSTPCVYTPDGGESVLIFNSLADGITAVDPDQGTVAWQLPGVFDKRSVSSPVIASGLVIGSCGSGGGGIYTVAVRPGDPANGIEPRLAYEIRRSANYVPSPVAVGDLLFLVSDAGGMATCVYAPTGEIRWQERLRGNFFPSPICVDGRLYFTSSEGDVVVAEASERFQILARNSLGEQTHATPAVAGGRIYFRTVNHLVALGGKE